MKIIDRKTNKELKLPSISELVAGGMSIKKASLKHYKAVLRVVYCPMLYSLYSIKMNEIIEKYKDVEIIPYKMTESDKRKLAKNPDYIEDIPRYYIPGFDEAASNWRLDGELAREFYSRFMKNDPTLVECANTWNEDYYLVLD